MLAQLTGGSAVSGTWVNPTAIVITSITPDGAKFDIVYTSGTQWHGSLEGTTAFTATNLFDPATNDSTGTIDETFTGSIPGVGSGTLRFTEQYSLHQGIVSLDATVVSGTGQLSTVTGTIHFDGTSDDQGIGNGTYAGTLQLPPPTSSTSTTSTTAPSTTTQVPAPTTTTTSVAVSASNGTTSSAATPHFTG